MNTSSVGHAGIPDIDPAAAWSRVQQGALLIDVREESEWAQGRPAGSQPAPGSRLDQALEQLAVPLDSDVLLICAGGVRSQRAAELLHARGFSRVASVAGGFNRWRALGLPLLEGGLDAEASERYDRHLRLTEIGVEGQRRLLASKVLLVGAGGLGSPAALYLAAAGVGTLTLVDDDRVERSNLQRQVLNFLEDVEDLKVASAKQRLLALNPSIQVHALAQRVDAGNVRELLAGQDLVIDGADNFATRYLLNAACLELGVPWVYGAVERFHGQVSLFQPGHGPCYRCLFPEPPPAGFAPNCAEAGVLGVLPGVIGLLQATEALKWLLGLGDSLRGRLLNYDALSMRFGTTRLERDPDCPGCAHDGPLADRLPTTLAAVCSI